MHVLDPVECLYLSLMHRWQTTAPPDHHTGLLDGEPAENSQVARLAYVLNKIAVGQVDAMFARLEKLTVKRDGTSHISRDMRRMCNPYPLWDGWYLEGCMSLEAKLDIVRQLRQLGLSPTFVRSVESFVANEPIDRYFPSQQEQEEVIRRFEREHSNQDH
jgi:hypothetical protein